MNFSYDQTLLEEWNKRGQHEGLYAVFSTRWSNDECEELNKKQQQLLFEILPNLLGKAVLDVGCGIGRLTKSLSEHGANVTGIDISDVMLQKARQLVPGSNVNFIQASASKMPFADQSFDVILAVFVLQHILDDALFDQSLAEILRVLKQGGCIFIVDGISNTNHRLQNSPTMRRTLQKYDILKKRCNLVTSQKTLCVADDYTILLWQDTSF